MRCHGCGATGDVLSLVAQSYGLHERRDFRQVLRAAAEVGGLWDIVHELETGTVKAERPKVAPPPPEPERTYPNQREVDALWDSCGPVSNDAEASAWLAGRGLDPAVVEADDLARALPRGARAPRWASHQRMPWTESGHRLIVPMRDSTGSVRSVRGNRITDADASKPKRLPPGGHKATELVMTCPIGTAMLQGTAAPPEVIIAEGEPDFFTWATRRTTRPTARIGIVSGSWSFAFAARMPKGAQVWIRTDDDTAGHRYAEEIAKTLRWHGCFVRRGGLRG